MKTVIALAAVNPVVGALAANADRLYAAYLEGVAKGADIVLTPEMGLTGYPLQDLTQRGGFLADVDAERTRLIAMVDASGHAAAIAFGHPTDLGRTDGNRRLVHNSATFHDPATRRTQVVHKTELPNYGVFDEKRNYLAGDHSRVVEWRGIRIGLLICEDGWFPRVARGLSAQGADLMLWMNGSPFSAGKDVLRRKHAAAIIADARVPLAYVNLVGGQDELVFDGDRFAWDAEGGAQIDGAPFREDVSVAEFDVERGQAWRRGRQGEGPKERTPSGDAEVYRALVLGVRDYLGKSQFDRVMLGYSGGVDSGLVAALACDALGPENVLLVRLPSKYSSDGSKDDAWTGALRLGCPLRTIDIEPMVEMSRRIYAGMTFDMNEPRPGSEPELTGVADENIQARARGNILMSISNQEGFMLLTTVNRSEAICGYGTLNGDLSGGFAPLKDTLKTKVWDLCRHRNGLTAAEIEASGYKGAVGDCVPEEIIRKPPSAELRHDQQDTDSLPPYPVLDAIIAALVDEERTVDQVVESGVADADTVLRVQSLVYRAEYKRRLGAPGVKIGNRLLGQDRRYPIVNHYRESAST